MSECRECGGQIPLRVPPVRGSRPQFCSPKCRKANLARYHQRWWSENRERELPKLAERVKAFNERNPDYFKRHYAKNAERKKGQSREWYRSNRERAAEQQRTYAQQNPEVIRAISRRSASKRRAIVAGVFVETVDPSVVFERDHGICGICQQPVDRNSRWEVDHVVPISKGGSHGYENVQLAHRRCNRAKGARLSEHQDLVRVAS